LKWECENLTVSIGKDMAIAAARAAEEKKAEDIQVMDMRTVMVDTDFFVVCSATTLVQVRAITNEIMDTLAKGGYKLQGQEGKNNNSWVLLDYGAVVVHIFLDEDRNYYNLEKLWADAKQIPLN